MFPRLLRNFPRRVVLTSVYVYCLLMVYRIADLKQEEKLQQESLKQELRDRALLIKAECIAHPPPLTKTQQNAQAAAAASAQLSKHYTTQHMKQALKDILYLPKNNISWCIVPKVASTSWSKALLELRGLTSDDLLHSDKPLQVILRDTYRPVHIDQINKTLGRSLNFLFARHPFQRIVSAYRNKLEDSYKEEDGSYFYNIYGRRIVEKYRTTSKTMNKIIDENDENDMQNEVFHREPTFIEFVDYLVDTDVNSYDEHWKPIWLQCHICDFSYDYIIKYENFQKEIDLLIRILKENGHFPEAFDLQWQNKGGTDESLTRQYLKQLSDDKLWKLYDKFRHDFGYFGYTMQDYLHL